MPRAAAEESREVRILDGVIAIISVSGFANTRMSDLARTLRCSTGTLYRVAASKEDLVTRAIDRSVRMAVLESIDAADRIKGPAARAQLFSERVVECVGGFSPEFFEDLEKHQGPRTAWCLGRDRAADQLAKYLQAAMDVGEARPMNSRYLAFVLSRVTDAHFDTAALRELGMTRAEALHEFQTVMWRGLSLDERVPQHPAAD